ncbi:MAG: hypothetical protein JHC57_13160 [Sphingopyxis sp.]|uniref:hypothetical protein n=1 Tax=Sphingopyxis sp. TaxID=1908224 RepID=UPI001A1F0F39|nr:hypothetical protein [Sphingopyxis sp.]MBJ7500694.1 hypothetical protein [Sphingopyxis sp.]
MNLVSAISLICFILAMQLGTMLLYRASLRRAGRGGVGFREMAIVAPAIVPTLLLIPVVIGLWLYSAAFGWKFAISFLWWGPVGAILAWLSGHGLMRWTWRQISVERRP